MHPQAASEYEMPPQPVPEYDSGAGSALELQAPVRRSYHYSLLFAAVHRDAQRTELSPGGRERGRVNGTAHEGVLEETAKNGWYLQAILGEQGIPSLSTAQPSF